MSSNVSREPWIAAACASFHVKQVAVLILIACSSAYAQQSLPTAFRSIEAKTSGQNAARMTDPTVRRARYVEADQALFDRKSAKQLLSAKRRLGAANAPVLMNLFEDRALTAIFDQVEHSKHRKSVIWTGRVEGSAVGHAVVVASDGRLTGNISAGDGLIYQIRPAADGTHSITEVDTRAFPAESEPRKPAVHDASSTTVPQSSSDGTTIDVMVIYTAATRAAAGGEAEMRQLIELGVAETNQGYSNSGLPQRVRLVATGEVNYEETGDLGEDLDRLTGSSDGHLDEVHRVRDAAGADLVSLWVEQGNSCGVGWLLADPSRPVAGSGFNVVRRNCATGYFSFGHEMGHNMGAMHAHEDGGGDGAFPFSHGYKYTGSAPFFRCIMSYDCEGTGCSRVNLWSSPEVRYRGVPVGTSITDNRATLLQTAAVVASYRQSTQPNTTPTPNGKNFPQSAHPYEDNTDRTWNYTLDGSPSAIYVTFDENTYVEEDYDWIVVTDRNGAQVEGSPFTGEALAGRTLKIPGDTVRIRLVTDDSITDYGFAVANVTAANGGAVDLNVVSFKAPRTGIIGGRMEGVVSVVRNDGAAAADAFRIAYYFVSAENQIVFSGWACDVPSLAPGTTYTCGGGIGVPSSLTAGDYVLAVVADDQERTQDSNFDNNVKASEAGIVTLRAQ